MTDLHFCWHWYSSSNKWKGQPVVAVDSIACYGAFDLIVVLCIFCDDLCVKDCRVSQDEGVITRDWLIDSVVRILIIHSIQPTSSVLIARMNKGQSNGRELIQSNDSWWYWWLEFPVFVLSDTHNITNENYSTNHSIMLLQTCIIQRKVPINERERKYNCNCNCNCKTWALSLLLHTGKVWHARILAIPSRIFTVEIDNGDVGDDNVTMMHCEEGGQMQRIPMTSFTRWCRIRHLYFERRYSDSTKGTSSDYKEPGNSSAPSIHC